MKKVFMATICLSLFAIALSLVQISCSKTKAQGSINNATPVRKILYTETTLGGPLSDNTKFSIMNYDGSGVQHLNIPFPAGFSVSPSTNIQAALSPDAKTIFFTGRENAYSTAGVYSCDTSGTNFVRIANLNANTYESFVNGAY